MHALLAESGDLKVNKKGTVQVVQRMDGLREQLRPWNIHLTSYKERSDGWKYYIQMTSAFAVNGPLHERLFSNLTIRKIAYLQMIHKMKEDARNITEDVSVASSPATPAQLDAKKELHIQVVTKSAHNLMNGKAHSGEIIQNCVTPQDGKAKSKPYRNVMWTLCDQNYTLPIHYSPITNKDVKSLNCRLQQSATRMNTF